MKNDLPAPNTRLLRVFLAIGAILLLNVAIFATVTSLSTPQVAYAQGGDEDADDKYEPDDKLVPMDFYPSPSQNGAVAYSLRDPWPKTDLTFYFHNCPTRLDCSAAHGAVREGFQTWANVSSLTFTEVNNVSQADIEVTFTSNDPEGYLGTPGGTLAYNYFPRYGGDMFIDDAEPWTIGDRGDLDLYLTATHEIGHGIGIDHSEYKDALMYPYAGFATELGEDDIQAVQELYGPPNSNNVPDNTTPNNPPNDVVDTVPIGSIDAVIGLDQEIKGTVNNNNPLNIYTLNVPANSTVTVTMYGTSGDLDPYLGIATQDLSTVLIENDNWYFNDARVVYSFSNAGTYSLIATRFGFLDGGTTGTYTLTIETAGSSTTPTDDVAPPAPQSITWRVTNYSGFELCAIYFSPTASDTWGTDQIANREPLQNGFFYEWQISPDTYDIQVWDCFGNKLERYGINATRNIDILVYQNQIDVSAIDADGFPTVDDVGPDIHTWRVSNYANVELCAIYFSPTTSDTWGPNQIGSNALEPNFYFDWQLEADTYDVRVEDCDGGSLEKYDIDLSDSVELAVYQDRIDVFALGTVPDSPSPPPTDPDNSVDVPDASTYVWRVSNYANVELCAIYFSPTTSDTWGPNQIGSNTLEPNFYFEWELEAETYDIRVDDCDDNSLTEFGIDLTGDTEISVFQNQISVSPLGTDSVPPPPADDPVVDEPDDAVDIPDGSTYTWRVANYAGVDLCAIYFSPNNSDTWGANQIEGNVLSSGFFFEWNLDADVYDIRVDDCNGNQLTRFGIDIFSNIEVSVYANEITTGTIGSGGTPPVDEPDTDVDVPNGNTFTWRVTNYTNANLCAIYFSPSTSDTWGANQITDILSPNSYFEWQLNADTYDVRTESCRGASLESYGIDLFSNVEVAVYQNQIIAGPIGSSSPPINNPPADNPPPPADDPAPPVDNPPPADNPAPPTEPPPPADDPAPSGTFLWRVSNYTSVDLCGIYFSPATSDTWGQNQIEGSVLSPNFYFEWELPADTYDILAEDCSGGILEYYGIGLFSNTEVAIFDTFILPGPIG